MNENVIQTETSDEDNVVQDITAQQKEITDEYSE